MHCKNLTLGAMTLMLLGACSSQHPSPNLGLANPAAIYCEDQGGSYEIDSGVCVSADGRRVDGWEFYRSQQ